MTRLLTCCLIVAATALGTHTASAQSAPQVQSARIHFARPTVVAGKVLVGDYFIVHDDAKIARGKPCISFYRSASQPAIAEFYCVPTHRTTATKFTLTTRRVAIGHWADGLNAVELLEFQYAGSDEAYSVPVL